MGLENVNGIDGVAVANDPNRERLSISASILQSLDGAKIVSGMDYDLSDGTYASRDSCDRCDCVCNQPCHGEGPCYSL